MKLRTALHAASYILLISCSSQITPPNEAYDVQDVCQAFCENASMLGCSEGKPSPGGATCVYVCENYHNLGFLKPYAPCGASAGDLHSMRACGVECKQQ